VDDWTDMLPKSKDITVLNPSNDEASNLSSSHNKMDFRKWEKEQKDRLGASKEKWRKNRQRESDFRKVASKHLSNSQRVRKAKEEQQERLATLVFGPKEERAKKLMGLVQCLAKMGESQKEKVESKTVAVSEHEARETEGSNARDDKMEVEEMITSKQDNSGGLEVEEASGDDMQVQTPNKSFAERGK